MPDLQEVFRMATQKVRPDPGALERQHGGQRRRSIRQKTTVFALVAALVIGGAVVGLVAAANRGGESQKPAKQPSPTSPTVVPDGKTPQAVVVVGLDGTTRSTVPGVPADAFALSLSPDGQTIAFITGTQDGVDRMATIGINGQGMRILNTTVPLASSAQAGTVLAWSPDGSRIAFVGLNDKENADIYAMDADGQNLHRLTTSPKVDEWPAWSPDGSRIVYDNAGVEPLDETGFSSTSEILTVPAHGGAPTRLTRNHADDSEPMFSPDGSLIAFHEDGGIWVMDGDGGNAHRIEGLTEPNFTPRWSPDGNTIAFTTYDGSWRAAVDLGASFGSDLPVLTVHLVDVRTGSVQDVGGAQVTTNANPPQWLPTGDALLLNRLQHP
jgi:Tol biopolymer transport system component